MVFHLIGGEKEGEIYVLKPCKTAQSYFDGNLFNRLRREYSQLICETMLRDENLFVKEIHRCHMSLLLFILYKDEKYHM